MKITETFYSIPELSKYLNVSEKTVRELAKGGRLPAVRIGRRVLFDPADVKAFVRALKKEGAGE